MGLRQWRVRRSMTDPVRGEFRVSGSYHPRHQADSNVNDMLTGVVVAQGVPPTVAEHMDRRMLGYTNRVLPVLVDRADPSVSIVLWKEVQPVDYQEKARQQARRDAQQVLDGPTTVAGEVHPVVVGPADLPPWLSEAVDAALRDDPSTQALRVELGDAAGTHADGVGSRPAGRAARATLVRVDDVAVPAYALPGPTASLTDLTLQVQRSDGSSYTAQTRMGFRSAERRAALAVIGSSVPLLVDPDDESHVSIDTGAWG